MSISACSPDVKSRWDNVPLRDTRPGSSTRARFFEWSAIISTIFRRAGIATIQKGAGLQPVPPLWRSAGRDRPVRVRAVQRKHLGSLLVQDAALLPNVPRENTDSGRSPCPSGCGTISCETGSSWGFWSRQQWTRSASRFWDMPTMADLFRFELIEAMFKAGVLTPEIANNLLSWNHSGFHVHATAPFLPDDGDLFENRMAYAFRPAVSLGRLSFDGERVTYRSRRCTITLPAVEFLAKLVLHIPDRYQNIRRYAGFYSSVVQRRIRAARGKGAPSNPHGLA